MYSSRQYLLASSARCTAVNYSVLYCYCVLLYMRCRWVCLQQSYCCAGVCAVSECRCKVSPLGCARLCQASRGIVQIIKRTWAQLLLKNHHGVCGVLDRQHV